MKLQSKSASRYVFKNIFMLLPFTVLPALLLTFFQTENGPITLFKGLYKQICINQEIGFSHFYSDLYKYFSLINIKQDMIWGINAVWFWILTILVTVAGLCLTFSLIERHIKFGTRSIGRVFSKINESFLYVMPYILLVFVVYQLWTLLLSGGIVLLSVFSTGWVFYTLSILLTVVFYGVFFVFFSMFLLTPPSMYFDGYKFGFAASYSARLTGEHFKNFVCRILLTVVVTQLFLGLCRFIPQQDWLSGNYQNIILLAVRFLCYLWWLMYLPALSACKYAEYTETKRADLKLKLFN